MKRFDIDAKMTELVGLYIADGWTLNTMSMSGHQGEDGKVDLVKGEELIRIWLWKESSHDWSTKDAWHGNTMYLRVGKWNYPAKNIRDSFSTAWMKDFYVIQEMKFYEITNRSDAWFVDSLEDALDSQKKKYRRWYSAESEQRTESMTNPKSIEIARRYLKRYIGYKRVSSEDIEVVRCYNKKESRYFIKYRGLTYQLR